MSAAVIGRDNLPATAEKARRAGRLAKNQRHHRQSTASRESSFVRTTRVVLFDGIPDVKRRVATQVRDQRRRLYDKLVSREHKSEIHEELAVVPTISPRESRPEPAAQPAARKVPVRQHSTLPKRRLFLPNMPPRVSYSLREIDYEVDPEREEKARQGMLELLGDMLHVQGVECFGVSAHPTRADHEFTMPVPLHEVRRQLVQPLEVEEVDLTDHERAYLLDGEDATSILVAAQ